jgi:hypothetical protein
VRQSQWPLEVFLRDREWMQFSALYNRSRKILPAMIPFTLLPGAYNPREEPQSNLLFRNFYGFRASSLPRIRVTRARSGLGAIGKSSP